MATKTRLSHLKKGDEFEFVEDEKVISLDTIYVFVGIKGKKYHYTSEGSKYSCKEDQEIMIP